MTEYTLRWSMPRGCLVGRARVTAENDFDAVCMVTAMWSEKLPRLVGPGVWECERVRLRVRRAQGLLFGGRRRISWIHLVEAGGHQSKSAA